jgi:hypothetical protein
MIMKSYFLALTFVTMTTAIWGQSSDSTKSKPWKNEYALSQRESDSLDAIVNSGKTPLRIFLELNGKRVPLPMGTRFYATITDSAKRYAAPDQILFEPVRVGEEMYQFSNLPDQVVFGLTLDTLRIETYSFKKEYFKFGMTITFGSFNNFSEIIGLWKKRKKELKEFDRYSVPAPYFTFAVDRTWVRWAKRGKIHSIRFFCPKMDWQHNVQNGCFSRAVLKKYLDKTPISIVAPLQY